MSIICKNCNSELPEEASFCLNCMTPVARIENSDTELINIKELSAKERLSSVLARIKSKFNTLSKKKKAALMSTLALLLLLVPLSIFLLSPAEPTNTSASASGGGSNTASVQDKPATRLETILDEVLGTDFADNGSSETSDTDNIADNSDNLSETAANPSTTTGVTTVPGTTVAATGDKNQLGSAGTSNTTNSTTSGNSETTDTQSKPVLNYDDWEYTISNSKVTVTKYTGNDKNIIIPDKFDGANLYTISNGTFKDNSTLETVTFKGSEDYHILSVSGSAFNNCSSLKKITFPKNTNIGISAEFAVNCHKLSEIEIDFWQFRFIEGCLYDYNGSTWVLKEYCEGYTASTYDVPTWCTNIGGASTNLSNNKYLKTINIHANCFAPSKQWNYYEYRYLENLNVESGNSYYESINGVLYDKSGSTLKLRIYPAGKNDKTYNVPENCTINCYGMKDDLFDKIETITLPSSSTIAIGTLEDILQYYPNLKTIKVEKGHPQYQTYKNTLDKMVTVTEY